MRDADGVRGTGGAQRTRKRRRQWNIGDSEGLVLHVDPQLHDEQREDDADVVHAEVFRRAQAQQNIRDQQQIEVLAAQRDPCQHTPNRQ